MFLGFDQSFTCSGYVVFEDDGSMIDYGTITTEKDQFASQFDRALYISDELMKILSKYDIKRVHMEGLAFSKMGNVTRDLGGLQYVIVQDLIRRGISYTITPPTTVKKFQTGSGKQKKEDLFEQLPDFIKGQFEVFKKTKGRYDVTDSYWIGKIGEFGVENVNK